MQGTIEKIKTTKTDDLSTSKKTLAVSMLFYIIWSFIGLFTFQWYVFLVFIIIGFIPKKHYIIRFVDGIVSVIILIFIILNAYYFQLSFQELLTIIK